jgi:hypothetical protein
MARGKFREIVRMAAFHPSGVIIIKAEIELLYTD